MIYTVSTTTTQALYYSNYYVSMIYIHSSYVAMISCTLLHSSILHQSMHSIPSYYKTNATSYDDRLHAAGGPPPMRAPGAARRTLNQQTKTMNSVLLYCFSVFAICVTDIYPKTHKPRGRASDVSTISTCFYFFCHDLLPTPPPISVRKAGGITVVYLCGF